MRRSSRVLLRTTFLAILLARLAFGPGPIAAAAEDPAELKLIPAERRFRLPSTFAKDGQVELRVRLITGANAVVSELWIWQLDH